MDQDAEPLVFDDDGQEQTEAMSRADSRERPAYLYQVKYEIETEI